MKRKPCAVFFSVFILVVPAVAGAQEADEPVVARPLYDLGGQFEVMLIPSVSVFDKYTQHVATSAGLAYYFNDYIGLEVEGGYAFVAGDRKLLNEIIQVGLDTLKNNNIERLPLTDLKYLSWWTTGGIVFNPLYGKLNFSSELAINFHLYFTLGAGVANYKYNELYFPEGSNDYQTVVKDVGIKPTFSFGGGVRVHIVEHWSLRLEIRDMFFYDQYDAWTPGASGRDKKSITDFVHITFFRLGASFTF